MMDDEMGRAMIDGIVLVQETEGTDGEIGVGPEIAVTASAAIGIGETGKAALTATDTMISEVCYMIRWFA
jgi:hypothetical protein